jgi:hypothetical protein
MGIKIPVVRAKNHKITGVKMNKTDMIRLYNAGRSPRQIQALQRRSTGKTIKAIKDEVDEAIKSIPTAKLSKCNTCFYSRPLHIGNTNEVNRVNLACHYSLLTDKLRGCPGGDECTVWKAKKAKNA